MNDSPFTAIGDEPVEAKFLKPAFFNHRGTEDSQRTQRDEK